MSCGLFGGSSLVVSRKRNKFPLKFSLLLGPEPVNYGGVIN